MSENLENTEISTDATEQSLDDFEQELFAGKAPEPKPVAVEETVVDESVNDSVDENDEPELPLEETDETEGDDQPEETETPKKESRAEKRIRELVAQKRELERLLEEKNNKPTAETPISKEQPKDELPEAKPPHWDDLDEKGESKYPLGQFDPQFNADLVRYTIKQEQEAFEKQRAQQDEQRRQQEIEARVQQEWEGKLAPALERYPDFAEKGQALVDGFADLEPNYAKYLTDTIRAIDNGPEVLYYLADNPDLARDIVNKGPAMATVMLGRISAMYDELPAPKETKTSAPARVTNAPTPPPKVRGTATPKTKDLDNLDDFEEMLFRGN